MGTREAERARLVPLAARALRSHDFRVAFTEALGNAARHTIIVALPDDSVGYIFEMTRQAGGSAVVAMWAEERFHLAFLAPASTARIAVAEEDDSLAEVSEASEVGMLFAWLRQVHSAVVCRVVARLVSDGRELERVSG